MLCWMRCINGSFLSVRLGHISVAISGAHVDAVGDLLVPSLQVQKWKLLERLSDLSKVRLVLSGV